MKSDEPFSLGDGSSAERLEAIVRRYESLIEDGRAIAADKRELRKEAKGAGFDWPTIASVIKRRELTPDEVIEGDQLLETYEIALGSGAQSVGTLSTQRKADGTFEIRMVQAPPPDAKMTKAEKRVRDSVLLAELEERARRGE